MNLLKLISNEEIIGGLEITHDSLRFILLKQNKSHLETKLMCQEKLSSDENLDNLNSFYKKLSKFARQNHIKYVIISLPADNIFLKTYNYPNTLPYEKIVESMKLNTELQLPQKKDDIYSDWMLLEKQENVQKVLLSYIKKRYADKLFAIFKKAGIKIVAVEPNSLSLSRIIKQVPGEATLVIEKSTQNISFSVIENNNLIFLQNYQHDKLFKNVPSEIEKIIKFFEWSDIKISNLFLIGQFSEKEIKNIPLKVTPLDQNLGNNKKVIEQKWLVALGAAKRGLIPRKDDKIISLMAIGTEQAYKQERINLIANFFIGVSIAIAIFFSLIFFTTWSFVSMIQENYNKRINAFSILPESETGIQLKEKVDVFNSFMSQTSLLIKEETNWSTIVTEINKTLDTNVNISILSMPKADGIFTITGTALNREAINALKKSFESSSFFTNVDIPLNNLGKKNDIPFTMTFQINDNNLIFKK